MAGRWKGCWPAGVVAAVLLSAGTPLAGGPTPASPLDSPIVFTQLPPDPDLEGQDGSGGGTLRLDYGLGGRVVRLEPDGQLRALTEGFSSACGADVSVDGQRILFSGKRQPGDSWNIWEMKADGSDVRQITRDAGNCRSPAYQATLYTIVSTEPWYQIMFVSDAAGALNEYGSGPATSLHSCKLDGTAVRRLTMNLSNDMDPFLMDDGRVLLASWQRMDLRRGLVGRVSLFGVNTDGTDYALYCGDQGRRVKHMPCATRDGLVVFVEADRMAWDGAGQLASLNVRRNFYSYRPITHDDTLLYHSPSPLADGAVLVSRRTADKATPQGNDGGTTHGIYRLDPRTGQTRLIYDDPDFHDLHARELTARPQPDGRSSVVNEKYATGKLYCLNAYLTDPAVQPYLRPGMIRRLRVIEGVPRSVDSRGSAQAPSGIVPVVQKRLLGEIPVEEDGSFHVELPADLPVQLQALDDNGMALRTCGWIWAKHREPRGCIGCHEDPELTPENRFVLALRKPGIELTQPADQRRTVDFRRQVMPTISAKCSACHTGGGAPPNLSGEKAGRFNQAYTSLLTAADGPLAEVEPVTGKYVHPGQARTSRLIWRLYGRNTSRQWDASYDPAQNVGVCPPARAEQLTDDEKMAFVEWVDLGAHWDGIPGPDEFSAGTDAGQRSENQP